MNDLSSPPDLLIADTASIPAETANAAPPQPVSLLRSSVRITLYLLMLLTMFGFTGRLFWWADYFAHPRLQIAAALAVVGLLLLAQFDLLRFSIAAAGCVLNMIAVTSAIPDSYIPPNTDGIPPGSIRVIQMNVNVSNPSGNALIGWIQQEKPDILVLTEANQAWLPVLDTLVTQLPYQQMAHHSTEYGMAILSRFPFSRADTGTAGPRSLPVLKLEIETPVGRIAVVGVHGNAPTNGPESRARDHYFAQVAAMVQTNGLPTVLVGDFNATPWSSGFESLRLLPNLQPSGLSIPASWPASLGKFGIPTSHILLSIPYNKPRPIMISGLKAGPALPGMTHLPLMAELSIK